MSHSCVNERPCGSAECPECYGETKPQGRTGPPEQSKRISDWINQRFLEGNGMATETEQSSARSGETLPTEHAVVTITASGSSGAVWKLRHANISDSHIEVIDTNPEASFRFNGYFDIGMKSREYTEAFRELLYAALAKAAELDAQNGRHR